MSRFWRRTALGLIVALPLLALVLLRANLEETADALGDANYALILPAMILFAAALWLQAVRWRYLLKPLADVSTKRLYPVLLIGHFGNAILPLRGGEIVRAVVLKRREGISRMAVLGTLAVERALDGVTLVGLLVISMTFVESSQRLWGLVAAGAVIFGGASAALVSVAFFPEQSTRVAEIGISRAPPKWRRNVRLWLESFFTGTQALRTPTGVAAICAATVAFWVVVACVYWIVGEAFHLDEGVGTYTLVTSAANLSVSIPSSQGGFGPFEFFVKQSLDFAGVPASTATAYALSLHAVLLIPVILLGPISLWLVGLSLTEVTHSAGPVDLAGPDGESAVGAIASTREGTSVSRPGPEAGQGADRP